MKSRNLHHPGRRQAVGAALCLLVATVAAVASVRSIGLFPPGLEPRPLQVAGSSAHIVVDMPSGTIGDYGAESEELDTLFARTVLLANLMTSQPVLERVGLRAGIEPDQIAASTRITANVQSVLTEPDSERRAAAIAASRLPYKIEVQPSSTLPTINVYTQAPSMPEAARLADAAALALREYLREEADRRGMDPEAQVSLEQLDPARASIISGRSKSMLMALTFVVAFALCAALLAFLSWALRRPSEPPEPEPDAGDGDPDAPARAAAPRPRPQPAFGGPLALAVGGLVPAVATAPPPGLGLRAPATRTGVMATARRTASVAGDWPRTTRVLPWMIAVLLAMVWLVPFNVIELAVSFPIDLKLDRLLLPFVLGTWALALAAGGPYAPRIRLTWIHAALGACAAIACLSLIADATSLNRTLELETGIKQLTLLGSYVTFFVLAASVVRRSEVPAFMTYTLGLALVCALGTLWEYRFHYNVFYEMSDKLLPGIFTVGEAESAALDSIGRRLVRGPAEIPLEAVAMLVMALPIALVGLIHARAWRGRILHGLASALLLAAMISTFRKSAFMAPISVVLTLAYFRRRELLRLAPLALVLILMIPVLAPGALGSVAFQLRGDRLGVNTVSDRTSDYDAVRPDVWTHLPLGRGYGTYDHTSYRILDMELLQQLIEVGVIGLAAYLFVIGAIVGVARAPIRARTPVDAPVALAAAAAAVGFFVLSTLFDVMSFPHCPYLFLWMAALLAVVVKPPDEEPRRWS
jgi:hypothetical protein